jgi:hypothetical protein
MSFYLRCIAALLVVGGSIADWVLFGSNSNSLASNAFVITFYFAGCGLWSLSRFLEGKPAREALTAIYYCLGLSAISLVASLIRGSVSISSGQSDQVLIFLVALVLFFFLLSGLSDLWDQLRGRGSYDKSRVVVADPESDRVGTSEGVTNHVRLDPPLVVTPGEGKEMLIDLITVDQRADQAVEVFLTPEFDPQSLAELEKDDYRGARALYRKVGISFVLSEEAAAEFAEALTEK